VTGLSGEIEEKLPIFDKGCHRSRIAHIGKINSDTVSDVMNVEKIAAVFGNKAVDQSDLGPRLHEFACERGTDKSKAPSHEDIGATENLTIRHARIVGRGSKDFL